MHTLLVFLSSYWLNTLVIVGAQAYRPETKDRRPDKRSQAVLKLRPEMQHLRPERRPRHWEWQSSLTSPVPPICGLQEVNFGVFYTVILRECLCYDWLYWDNKLVHRLDRINTSDFLLPCLIKIKIVWNFSYIGGMIGCTEEPGSHAWEILGSCLWSCFCLVLLN